MQEALGFLDKMPLAVGAGDLNFAFSPGDPYFLFTLGTGIDVIVLTLLQKVDLSAAQAGDTVFVL